MERHERGRKEGRKGTYGLATFGLVCLIRKERRQG